MILSNCTCAACVEIEMSSNLENVSYAILYWIGRPTFDRNFLSESGPDQNVLGLYIRYFRTGNFLSYLLWMCKHALVNTNLTLKCSYN